MKMETADPCEKSVAVNGRMLPHIRDNVHLCQWAYDHKIRARVQTMRMAEQVYVTHIRKEYNTSARKSEPGRPQRRREYNSPYALYIRTGVSLSDICLTVHH